MTAQLTITGGVRYRYPLSINDRRAMFAEWCEVNEVLVTLIETKALRLAAEGHKRISTQYLAEWVRYEIPIKAVAVPYEDEDGHTRAYSFNNSDCAMLGRWLLAKHPDLPIECRRSVLDEVAACAS